MANIHKPEETFQEDFEYEEGEITPTMKAKRKVIEKKYTGVIDEMYKESVEAN